MLEVGCRPEAIRVVGNMKFDAAKLDARRELDVQALLRQIGVPPDALILVGGSTHDGEEVLLAEIAQRLRARFPKLFLVLVPRHFERGHEVGQQLRQRGVRFVFRSLIGPGTRQEEGEVECLLVNTTGELRFFYKCATVVFVGKSVTSVGGQNPIEPGALGKAMVFGPNMQNFAEIARSFVARRGAIQVGAPEALESAIGMLLADENRREELGSNAQQVVRENRGAVDRTVEMILVKLKERKIYIASEK